MRLRSVAWLGLFVAWLASPAAAQPRDASFTLALGGDVIFDAPIEYVLRARGLSPDEPASYDELLADLRAPLASADLAIVNLETPVGPRVRDRSPERDFPTFAAPPAFLEAFARVGVDVVTVANNHAYDQGVAGLATTIAHAERLGLAHAGSALGAGYAVREVRGLRVAVVSLTQGVNHPVARDEPRSPRVQLFDEARFTQLLADARARADVVIAALHFTDTGDHMPTRGMRVWSRRAAEAGADLVVGHGPHVPASLAWHQVGERRVPIFHSLGNLLAAMQAEEHAERSRAPHVRDSLVVTVRVTREAGRVTVEPPRVAAFWIDDARSPTGRAPFTRPVAIDPTRSDTLALRARRLAALLDGTSAALTVAAAQPEVRAPEPPSTARPTPDASPRRPPASTPPAPEISRVEPLETRAPTPSPAEVLAISFRCQSARETSLEDASIGRWVARMQDDRALRLEVASTRCPDEPRAIALRRARRAAGLIATRGPSRSRFTWRVLDERSEPPRVTAAPR